MKEESMPTHDLIKFSEILAKESNKAMRRSNSLWYKLLRLLITLSSSFLLVTIALAKDLFHLDVTKSLPIFLVLGWSGYFLTIIFGIVAEINEVVFLGGISRSSATLAHEVRIAISKGAQSVLIKDDKAYIDNSIVFGVICINAFILSTVFLCLSFLGNFAGECFSYWVIALSIFLLILMNFYFIQKRKNYPKTHLIEIDNQ